MQNPIHEAILCTNDSNHMILTKFYKLLLNIFLLLPPLISLKVYNSTKQEGLEREE